jgi:hypothetical protein
MASKIDTLVQEFVVNLRRAIAQEAAAAFAQVGQSGGSVPSHVPPAGPVAKAAKAPKSAPRAKGAKRTAEEIEAQTKLVLAHLRKNPDQRAEQIGAALSMTTADLVLPIKKLIEAKALAKPKGARRGTTYAAK